jgi:hypothetical protein
MGSLRELQIRKQQLKIEQELIVEALHSKVELSKVLVQQYGFKLLSVAGAGLLSSIFLKELHQKYSDHPFAHAVAELIATTVEKSNSH